MAHIDVNSFQRALLQMRKKKKKVKDVLSHITMMWTQILNGIF